MEISEVRIKLVADSSERLRAFCSITLDGDFVIRDLKIIDGVSGPFVAMPSRKLADRCSRCGCKNHLRAKFCNDCGQKLNENRAPKDSMGRAKLHADVAHPINAGCRERIQTAVVKAYEAELERSKSPDYKPPVYDDFGDDDVTHLVEEHARAAAAPPPAPKAPPPTPPEPAEEFEPAGEPEPAAVGGDVGKVEDEFSDYNSLIADLKREAAGRQGREGSYVPPPPAPRPPQPAAQGRGERGDRGDRGDRGGRDDRGPRQGGPRGRDDRGPRRQDRRDDRPQGGGRRDQGSRPPRSDRGPEAPMPAPMRTPPPPPPPQVSPPPQVEEQDDFAAGL